MLDQFSRIFAGGVSASGSSFVGESTGGFFEY